MKHKLGIDTFRSGQLECINALALHGRDAWVGFACGGGKSLVFAAAMLLLSGVGILIEPLNAISTAMSTYLLARAVKTILLDGTKAARASAVAALLGDPDQPPVVIIGSPESVLHPAILAAMRSPIERGDKQRILCSLSDASLKNSMTSRVSLIGIDEAHTVSQWSVRFRPHFARLGELRAAVETWDYNSAPICAMTATATPAVRSAVKISIGFNDEGAVEEIQSLCRPNVAIYVHAPGNVSGKRTNAAAKAERVVHALHNPGVVLVFVSTLRATTAVANVISFAILTIGLPPMKSSSSSVPKSSSNSRRRAGPVASDLS
jgi:ATP-dependent DNA helicase RecQ